MVPLHFRWQYFAAFAASLFFLGVILALYFGNPHLLASFGALIAAAGAVTVVIHIQYEIVLEHEFREQIRRLEDAGKAAGSPGMEATLDRITKQSREHAHQQVKKSRISAAVIVAIITAFGEVVHGFGEAAMHLIERMMVGRY
jgi:hypothetical protein